MAIFINFNEDTACSIWLKCFRCDHVFSGKMWKNMPAYSQPYAKYFDPKNCPYCNASNGESSDQKLFQFSKKREKLMFDQIILLKKLP